MRRAEQMSYVQGGQDSREHIISTILRGDLYLALPEIPNHPNPAYSLRCYIQAKMFVFGIYMFHNADDPHGQHIIILSSYHYQSV